MSDELERSSTENVTVVTGNFPTVSSLKSEDSTEQLICKTPQKSTKSKKGKSVSSKSVEAGSDDGGGSRRIVVFLGLSQVVLGVLLVGGGALAVVKGAALSRVGAGLWSGCIAVVAGVVGVIAGINDCYGLNGPTSGGLLTAFLALSLLCLACGNSAAVLAATGLQRDSLRPPSPLNTFEDEMQAWSPVLTNIGLLIIASVHCLVCIVSIYHLSRRVCSCFRPKQAFDHNQFDPAYKAPCVFHVDEIKKTQDLERLRGHELCKELEAKLQGDSVKKKEEPQQFGSANSKEHLVDRWVGRQASTVPRPRRAAGVRKHRKPPAPLVLLPAHPAHPAHAAHAAHPASTLGRMPVSMVVSPRYATLPLPPAPYAPPAQIYYPIHDTRMRRRRSPRAVRHERRRQARERDSLTRSLERIHRKRRADRERPSDADLKRTYTGLDRAYAEQFIAVCDESRHAAEQHDSLASSATDSTNSQDTR
ncbi:uncharacterized protein LOC123695711 [Colias croceus]|uniref:uncharacterized protein LOC123695711 n=1 Tax=Colias crocea TaxID=72248 RepID=UPI001E27EBEB|nr:uncharacterized protein LOC123695711 [Colias croceus]